MTLDCEFSAGKSERRRQRLALLTHSPVSRKKLIQVYFRFHCEGIEYLTGTCWIRQFISWTVAVASATDWGV